MASSQTLRIGIDCRMYSSKFTGIGRYVYELVHHLATLDTQHEYVLFFNEPEYSSFVLPNERFSKVLCEAAMQGENPEVVRGQSKTLSNYPWQRCDKDGLDYG